MSQLHRFQNIRLKPEVDEADLGNENFEYRKHPYRTPGKDDAAKIVLSYLKNDDWPIELTQLEERTKWSRTHYQNVLRDYFEPIPENEDETQSVNTQQQSKGFEIRRDGAQIHIPDDVDNMADFLRGVEAGLELCQQR